MIVIDLIAPHQQFSAIKLKLVRYGHGFKKYVSILLLSKIQRTHIFLNRITSVDIYIAGWSHHYTHSLLLVKVHVIALNILLI